MGTYVHFAAVVVAIIFFGISLFQILLTLGVPLGKATMGGKYKILPKPMRFVSAFSAIILLFMGFVYLQDADVVSMDFHTNLFVWVFTIYLAINTLLNLFSKSKIERNIMTPISSVAFVLSLIVALS